MRLGHRNHQFAITTIYVAAISMVAASVLAQNANSEPAVKMSRSGICHEHGTVHYQQTIYFEPYESMEACLTAGGRRMGGEASDEPQPYTYRGTHPPKSYVPFVIVGIIAVLALIIAIGKPWWQRR